MCSINSHNRQQSTYVDDSRSAGGRAIPKNATTTALKSLGATLNFIYFWIKHFQHDYQKGFIMYHESMIELFKQIPTIKSKPLSQD